MKRKFLISIVVGLALFAVAADKPPETLDQLQARAAAADKKKQTELYVDLAERQLQAANDAYNTNPDQAKALFEQASKSAELAAQASLDANHKLKKTEIKLRELSHHMSDIRRTWAFEDRAPLDPDIQRVETARNKLLDRMFQK